MDEKLSLLADLIKMAKSDEHLRPIEYDFIKVIALRLGIPEAERERLFHENIDYTPPQLETNRILQFQRLIMIMNIDRNQTEEEMNLIRDLGIKMGLNVKATEQVLAEMNEHENNVLPVERLVEIFQYHHN